eukprot:CAMPEP_0204633028 /NCGR_PEP_ID=MMETSP0717-20131115/26243_1 /ASSEMBLY_ACC=CAM_ASM_000666 /TAXON_ID=230516 /ORGANISM="Chaetoceros curvisetus" /LENGTH=56 /DNA_ID=CAMNT_0051651055 /DNA_START=639 /DNA_END=809 /DNA_ORIENTATION=-
MTNFAFVYIPCVDDDGTWIRDGVGFGIGVAITITIAITAMRVYFFLKELFIPLLWG